MASAKKCVAVIVAAGTGSRAGGDTPKQFRLVGAKPLLRHSYEALISHPLIESVIVVVGSGQEEIAAKSLFGLPEAVFVEGGRTRRESVQRGLEAIAEQGGARNVLIHDGARPFLSSQIIDRLIAALDIHAGAVPALPVVDSLARGRTTMENTVERDGLWRIQTPQAFHFDAILSAHRAWNETEEPSDDARMVMARGFEVAIIKGDEKLAKFTFAEDFSDVSRQSTAMIRTGTGFDVHRLVVGEQLWLCGVRIDHTHGLSGHSDADVAIHALTDAILGALALGDIGDHFPPSDPQWRGSSSDQFLNHAIQLAAEKGYALANADVTIICEAPKIGPHRLAMRARLAEIMGVDIGAVSVKATTTELLGFTGRSEGIAAQTIVTMQQRG